MLSDKPYLIRALYDWIVDSGCTPYLTVDVNYHGVEVPMEYVDDGQIILNIAPEAVSHLELGNQHVTFVARFSGRPMDVVAPIVAIASIYAFENGRGMMFELEEDTNHDRLHAVTAAEAEAELAPEDISDSEGEYSGSSSASNVGSKGKRGHLTLVK